MNLLEVKSLDLPIIRTELEAKIAKAPAFFKHAPIVIGFELLEPEHHRQFDLAGLVSICKNLDLLPAATRGGDESLQQASVELGLATLAKGREKHMGAITEKPSTAAEPSEEEKPQAQVATSPAAKIITTPVRSGQQVYAPGGDLIVLAAVSPGAEVLADGNIHIYGALRGRALAGVKGDSNARIFCTSQEAELVAIAGHFLVDDQLRSNHWQQAVQINIANDTVNIVPLQ